MSETLRAAAQAAGLRDLDLLQIATGETDQAKVSNLLARFPGAFQAPTFDASTMTTQQARSAFQEYARNAERIQAAHRNAALRRVAEEIGDVRNMTDAEYREAKRKMGMR